MTGTALVISVVGFRVHPIQRSYISERRRDTRFRVDEGKDKHWDETAVTALLLTCLVTPLGGSGGWREDRGAEEDVAPEVLRWPA